jgi:hypothetical protein
VPVFLCLGVARALALVAKNPPLTVDNVLGLTQMSECDIAAAQADLGFRPLSFREGLARLRRHAPSSTEMDSKGNLGWQRESQ